MVRKIQWLVILTGEVLFCCDTVKGQNILFRPLKYNEPHKETDIRPVPPSERDPVVPWFVIAVQENASATSGPGSGQRTKNLKFGELFWVIEEQGDYIRIARDDRPNVFELSSRAEIYGWVRKDDVLLWQSALSEPQTKISLKGMIMNTTRALSASQANYRRIQAFKDPALQIPTQYEARLFEIFYVFKYSPRHNSVLLARRPYFSPRDHTVAETTGIIVGWVNLDRVLEWDHRVAIEPNWDAGAVRERQQKNIRASIFYPASGNPKDRCAQSFSRQQSLTGCDIAWNDDLWDSQSGEFDRKPGYWRRFPVVGDHGANIYKIMVMGELTGETGVIREEVDIQVRQTLNELIGKIRNINVVFVIDGTSSMGPFYRSVINSVQRIVEIFRMSDEAHKELRFGYVVYRDFLERDRLIETRQLTPNAEQIIAALRRVEANDLYDTDAHEAVYYGLRAAISGVFRDPNETNILIHIGDAGNHYRNDPSQVPQSEIVDLLAQYKCYYIAFQAHHTRDHQAYIDFPHQIREIMSRASERLYQQWVSLLGEDVVTQRPVLRQVSPQIHRIENGPPMVVVASERGRTMDLTHLENEIIRAIEEIDNYTDMVVEKAREMLERGQGIEVIAGESQGTYASAFAPGVYNFLVRMGLGDDMIRSYYSKNVQFVTEGYASRHHQSLNTPLFSPVLLMENVEFMRILLRLNTLRQATATPGDRREQLFNAWIELLKRHVGLKPQSEYEELSLEQAASMVFGVPLRATMLQQIQLKDIFDESVFPNTALNRYINHIAFKYTELERISNTPNYPYSFISNDILYYWIDVDLLP